MSFVLILFIYACIYGSKRKIFNSDYISRETTIQINGIFVFLVFLSHFVGYLEMELPFSYLYMNVRGFLSQLVVTTFLFYSGYGVLVSINRNKDYTKMIPLKIIELIVSFSLAILLFVMIQTFFGKEYTVSKVLLACIGWQVLEIVTGIYLISCYYMELPMFHSI